MSIGERIAAAPLRAADRLDARCAYPDRLLRVLGFAFGSHWLIAVGPPLAKGLHRLGQ